MLNAFEVPLAEVLAAPALHLPERCRDARTVCQCDIEWYVNNDSLIAVNDAYDEVIISVWKRDNVWRWSVSDRLHSDQDVADSWYDAANLAVTAYEKMLKDRYDVDE